MAIGRNGTAKLNSIATTRSIARRRARALSPVLKCACESLERRTLFATVTWITDGGGEWSVGANWSTGNVPGPADTAVLDVPGRNVTITYSAAPTLQLTELVNNELLSIINVNGASWTGGTWSGNGQVQIEIGSRLAIAGAADKIIRDGQAITNFGTTTLSGTGNIIGQVGASIVNFGTFDVRSDADITFPTGVGDGIFANGGIFLKSIGGTGPNDRTEIGGAQGFRFENSVNNPADPQAATPGDCQILQGTLSLGDPQNVAVTRGGTFEISAGATLEYLRGEHNIVVYRPRGAPQVIPSITGAGTLRMTGGTMQHYGTFAVHQVDMNNGTFLLQQNMNEFAGTAQRNSNPATTFGRADIINLVGGTFGGNGGGIFNPGPVELPGLVVGSLPAIVPGNSSFNWVGSTLSGRGRLVVDVSTTSSTITTTNPKAIVGGYGLDLMCQTLWRDSSTLTLNGASAIDIHGGGTLWDQNDGTIVQGGADALGGGLWNAGTFLKSGGTGSTVFGAGIDFFNDRATRFRTPAIPTILYPDLGSPLPAQLDIRTGTVSLLGTSTNFDNLLLRPGATLSYDAGTHIHITDANSNDRFNATILGLNHTGTVNFGNVVFTSDDESLLDVGQANFGIGTYRFDNTADGAQLVHDAVFDGLGTGTIGGAGTLEISGSLLWNSGRFVGNNLATSSLLIDTGATLTIPSGDRSTFNSYAIDNRGTIAWTASPGLLDINGDYRQGATGTFSSRVIGAPPLLDRLRVSGNVTLDGALALALAPGFVPVNGQAYTLIDNAGLLPITGQFVGLPQGETVTVGGTPFIVNYLGGDGNDLVLTATIFPVITIGTPAPIVEGNTGTTDLVFTVTLSEAVALAVSVNYTTTSGSATSGVDFVPTTGTLTIPLGQLTGTISVPIIGDLIAESTQSFTLTLSAPVHGVLGTQISALGTIVDDDGPPEISVSQTTYGVLENAGVATVTVIRTNPSVAVTVDYATSPGDATPGVDYTSVSGTLSFAIGVISLTFDVPIIDDATPQGARSFNVTLSNPQGGAATVGEATAIVTVFDNDPPPPVIAFSDALATEAISGLVDAVFTVTLSSPVAAPLTVQYTVVDGTAVAGSDFIGTTGTVTFAPNQLSAQLRIPIRTDFVQEVAETFTVVLSSPSGGATLPDDTATGTILNQNVNVVTIDATHPYRYIDSSANLAVIAMRGQGIGALSYLGLPSNDAKALVLDGTNGQTQLLVRTSRYQTFLVDLTVNGSIFAIDGPALNLQGNLTVTGGLQRLRLNNLLGGNVLNIGAGAASGLLAALNNVNDTTLTSAAPIAFLRVASWQDSSAGVDISAPSAAIIGAVGSFEADMTLTGDLGFLRVGTALRNSTIRVGGNINMVLAGTMNSSTLFAGVNDAVTTLPGSILEFANTTSQIKRVIVASPAAGAFSGTRIAAPSVGIVQLGQVAVSNGGAAFGVAGSSINFVRGRNGRIINLTNSRLVGSPFSEGDLLIRLTV